MTTEDHILLEATTLEQKKYIWALNAVEWKGPLTIPQYVAREVAMMQGRAHRVPQKVWYLAEKSNPDVVLCACESFKRPMYVAQRRLDGSLEVNVTYGHAIASVYCREANRKKGYASEMMRQLGKALETDPWDRTMETPCSYLYSDIGKVGAAGHDHFNAALTIFRSTTPGLAGKHSHLWKYTWMLFRRFLKKSKRLVTKQRGLNVY